MWLRIALSLLILEKCISISSPIRPLTDYTYSIELEKNVADLWWTIDDNQQEITFELHIKISKELIFGIVVI